MNARLGLACGVALIVASACGRERDGTAMTPFDHAVAAAKAVRANPARADSILRAHGFTRDGFDTLMYEIAADSARAQAYTDAIK